MSVVAEKTVSPHVLSQLAGTYEVAHGDAVMNFIRLHPRLAPLLLDARDEIREAFGAETRTALDVVHDPEEEDSGMLIAFIQTTLDPDEALDRLDRFSDGWWRRAIGSEAVPLHFVNEYV